MTRTDDFDGNEYFACNKKCLKMRNSGDFSTCSGVQIPPGSPQQNCVDSNLELMA